MTVSSDQAERPIGHDRMRRLVRLADVLSEAVTVEQAVEAVVEAGAEALMADSVSVCLLDEAGTSYRLAGSGGLRADMAQEWAVFPADAPVPVVDAVRDRRLVVIDGTEDRERRYPVFGRGRITSETVITAPMLLHGEAAIGGLAIGFAEQRALDEVDRDFVQAAADLCGQAVHRARLLEYQQRNLSRQRFLADASAVLAAELDHDKTLREVAQLVVGELADVCAVCLHDDDGVLLPVTAVHVDRAGQAVLDALVDRQPVIRNEALLQVARTGEAVFVAMTEPRHHAEAEDDAHLQLMRELDVVSAMVVPLRARGHVLGLLLLLTTSTSGRTFDEDDRQVAADLAARAALAIDNARLYTERTELVEHLQVALSSHRAIEQAKGILAARWDVSPTQAFERMRRHARSSRRKIEDVAQDVVAGHDELTA